MTLQTIPPRPDVAPDLNAVADTVARMIDMADAVRTDLPLGRVGALSLILADAWLLTTQLRGWDGDVLEELAGRLWMVAR